MNDTVEATPHACPHGIEVELLVARAELHQAVVVVAVLEKQGRRGPRKHQNWWQRRFQRQAGPPKEEEATGWRLFWGEWADLA